MIRRLVLTIAICLTVCAGALAETWGVVKVPVACMRGAAGHSSEMVSQAILGTPVKILSQNGQWYKIETPDGYQGMMIGNSLRILSQSEFDNWRSSDRRISLAPMQYLYIKPDTRQPHGYATFGSILGADDGRSAADSENLREWAVRAYEERSAEAVIAVAESMLGAPYLWGGTSTLAPDCSGFTQTAYKAAGILLPRDAWQQGAAGIPVASIKDARPGDLFFYSKPGGKINHVSMYLGNGKIIHSSGCVRICRIASSVEGNEELYTDHPVAIRRYISTNDVPGIMILRDHPFFFSL